MNAAARALFGWWSKLDRSPGDVERDVDEEIAFHLDCAAREIEARGLGADAARAAAREHFGDVAAIAAACRKTQLGARIMLQRIQLVLLVALVLAVGAMAWRSLAAENAASAQVNVLRGEIARLAGVISAQPFGTGSEREPIELHYVSWMSSFQAAREWREGARLADHLANVPPDESTAVLQRIFASIPEPDVRQQVLKAFALRGGRSNALPILHLGMLDAHPEVRLWARNYLRSYAWRIFVTDQEALAWSTENAEVPIVDVLESSTDAFLAQLKESDPEISFALLHTIDPQVLARFGSKRTCERVRTQLTQWIGAHANEWRDEWLQHAAREALHFDLYVDHMPAVRAYTRRLESRR